MQVFSEELERELLSRILESVERYLESRSMSSKRMTGLITAKEMHEELDIDSNTLKRWESLGLKRYMPPVENTRKIYYRVSDVLKFLGIER
ncbi:XRE family transcriptional regulator [Streptococcus sp. 10F2]